MTRVDPVADFMLKANLAIGAAQERVDASLHLMDEFYAHGNISPEAEFTREALKGQIDRASKLATVMADSASHLEKMKKQFEEAEIGPGIDATLRAAVFDATFPRSEFEVELQVASLAARMYADALAALTILDENWGKWEYEVSEDYSEYALDPSIPGDVREKFSDLYASFYENLESLANALPDEEEPAVTP